MRRGFPSLLFAVLMVAVVPRAAEAKCLGQGVTVLPTYLMIVDGQVAGEFAMADSPQFPPADQLVGIYYECRELEGGQAENRTVQTTVLVWTVAAVPEMLSHYLSELVSTQREYFAEHGRYAPTRGELGIIGDGRFPPVEMTVTSNGWRAVSRLDGHPAVCRVAVGDEVGSTAGSEDGVPYCGEGE